MFVAPFHLLTTRRARAREFGAAGWIRLAAVSRSLGDPIPRLMTEKLVASFQVPSMSLYSRLISAAAELEGDQLGELGRDVCHWRFCGVQAASRAEQGADFAESFIRRVVHDGNEQVTR